MAFIETKYGIGDVVWSARTRTDQKSHPCPDCLGSQKWEARSPAGGVFEVACPRCAGGYQSNRALSLTYSLHVPCAQRLTIGQVRAFSGPDGKNEYMAHETGVGSGSLWYEDKLFATEDEAVTAAQAMADALNADPEHWVAKQYSEAAKFADYQLRDAVIEEANSRRIASQVRIGMLLQDLEDADSLASAQASIKAWRERDA